MKKQFLMFFHSPEFDVDNQQVQITQQFQIHLPQNQPSNKSSRQAPTIQAPTFKSPPPNSNSKSISNKFKSTPSQQIQISLRQIQISIRQFQLSIQQTQNVIPSHFPIKINLPDSDISIFQQIKEPPFQQINTQTNHSTNQLVTNQHQHRQQ